MDMRGVTKKGKGKGNGKGKHKRAVCKTNEEGNGKVIRKDAGKVATDRDEQAKARLRHESIDEGEGLGSRKKSTG